MNMVRLEELSYEALSKLVNTRFRVWVGQEDAVELELCEATPPRIALAGGTNQKAYESFSLFFRGPTDHVLAQRIYAFDCERLGRFELFIVPVGRDQRGTKYEAAFNRLARPEETRKEAPSRGK